MKKFFAILVFLTAALTLWADAVPQSMRKLKSKGLKTYIYRYTLRDKIGTTGTLDNPHKYLSRKSIERRRRQGLPIDSTDLPVSRAYMKLFRSNETRIVGTSRWNNTILVLTTNKSEAERLASLSCVKESRCVWEKPDSIYPPEGRKKIHYHFNSWDSLPSIRYGAAEEQLRAIGVRRLHDRGFTGKGMTIAVLDGGFMNVDRIPAFSRINIEGIHDFVQPPSPSIFCETDHGTRVLSTLALDIPHVYIGAAPDASYWLLRCEDQQSEQPVEEDYWAMAAEFADSVGADIVSSSLGYNIFDNHNDNPTYQEMDGRTTIISRTASMMANKGIVVVNSIGNAGMEPWKKMTFPADAFNILAVGAVTPEKTNASFNSVGPTQDGRIKPDVMAIGAPANVVSGRGTIVQDMGTSFAAPQISGLAACLWQSLPDKTAIEIIDIIRNSGSNAKHPDNIFGYGLPTPNIDKEKAEN